MVEIIPTQKEEIPRRQKLFLYSSVFLFLFLIVLYLVFLGVERNFRNTLTDLKEKIAQNKTPEIISLEERVLTYQRKISDFSQLLDHHLFPSKVFQFLEEKLLPSVVISQANLNSREAKMTFSGVCNNFSVLSQQGAVFEKEPLIKDFNLSHISLNPEGKVDFTFEISFDPKIFQY